MRAHHPFQAQKLWLLLIVLLFSSCGAPRSLSPNPTPNVVATQTPIGDEAATLLSLQKVDDYPLYTMQYRGAYQQAAGLRPGTVSLTEAVVPVTGCQAQWGCSLFTAMADENDRLMGRNFDWQFSPALLLFTRPPDGYASVSMVDIAYLGFDGERFKNLTDLPPEQLRALLDAPYLPFDGMNEKGLAVGMSAVTAQRMPYNPLKRTVRELEVIREMLDHAGSVDEAIGIIDGYNIDMGDVPIHYLIADVSGKSAVVEFYEGERRIFRNQGPWQVSTNFLLSAASGHYEGWCWRYDLLDQRLRELQGKVSPEQAMSMLKHVAQNNTQWSIVYHMTSGEVEVVMGKGYSGEVHTFQIE